MKPFVASIVKDSKRLLREVVSVCGDFPQKLKFIAADRLYELAMDGLLRAQDAARLGDKRAAEQLSIVLELIEQNDRLQALIDVSFDLKCFKSAGQYEALLKDAEKVGAQAGGWKKQIEGLLPKKALPNKQSPEPSPQLMKLLQALERLGALSTDAASAEANT